MSNSVDLQYQHQSVSADNPLAVAPVVSEANPMPIRLIGDDGGSPRVSATQELIMADYHDFINVQFQYNVPVNQETGDVIGVATGLGNVTHSDSMAVVASGNGVGDYALVSKDSIRYYPGHEFGAEMTALSLGTDANSRTLWGVGDPGTTSGDGLGFTVTNGQLSAWWKRNGTMNYIAQADFNGDKIPGINLTKLSLWKVTGGWYGILPLEWSVFHQGEYKLLHTVDLSNTQDGPHLSNPTLPVFMQAIRTSGTGNVQIKSASWRGRITGDEPDQSRADRQFVTFVESKSISGGVTTHVLTLRNNATFQGKANHVRARYGTVALSVDGTKDVIWEVWKNGTVTGGSYTAANAVTSVTDVNTTATGFSGGAMIGGTVMGKVSQLRIDMMDNDAILPVYPGETITLTARSANSSTVSAFIRWVEEF